MLKMTPWIWKWMMRLYPPFFLNGIWISEINKNYSYCKVVVRRHLFNININYSLFGGTLFSAADPIYTMMFWAIARCNGIKTLAWLKSAKITYKQPAHGKAILIFEIEPHEADIFLQTLKATGKYVKTFKVFIKNKQGDLLAEVETEIYLKTIG